MNPAAATAMPGFYITGGTLRRDAPCYVERSADAELYGSLREGRFCYVLTARQMGKSSLMVRTAARLREEAGGVAVLDRQVALRAVTLEPDFAMAHARIGYVYAVTWNHPERAKPYLELALQLGQDLDARERLHVLAW